MWYSEFYMSRIRTTTKCDDSHAGSKKITRAKWQVKRDALRRVHYQQAPAKSGVRIRESELGSTCANSSVDMVWPTNTFYVAGDAKRP